MFRLAREQERQEELAGIYLDAADRLGGSDPATELRELAAGILEKELARHAQIGVRKNIARELIRVYSEHLQQPDLAFLLACRVFREDPEDPVALTALAKLYREQGNNSELVSILKKMARLEKRSDEKIELLYELAQLTEDQPASRQQAVDAYVEILCEDMNEIAAAKMLNRLYLSMAARTAPQAA